MNVSYNKKIKLFCNILRNKPKIYSRVLSRPPEFTFFIPFLQHILYNFIKISALIKRSEKSCPDDVHGNIIKEKTFLGLNQGPCINSSNTAFPWLYLLFMYIRGPRSNVLSIRFTENNYILQHFFKNV